jgi:hypothetical protein
MFIFKKYPLTYLSVNLYRRNVLSLVKLFISKKYIGEYLDKLPEVNYEFKKNKGMQLNCYLRIGAIVVGVVWTLGLVVRRK